MNVFIGIMVAVVAGAALFGAGRLLLSVYWPDGVRESRRLAAGEGGGSEVYPDYTDGYAGGHHSGHDHGGGMDSGGHHG